VRLRDCGTEQAALLGFQSFLRNRAQKRGRLLKIMPYFPKSDRTLKYRSLDANSLRQPMMGARTLIDMVMNEKVGDVGSFRAKLKELEQRASRRRRGCRMFALNPAPSPSRGAKWRSRENPWPAGTTASGAWQHAGRIPKCRTEPFLPRDSYFIAVQGRSHEPHASFRLEKG
jgi:hypothetical protein